MRAMFVTLGMATIVCVSTPYVVGAQSGHPADPHNSQTVTERSQASARAVLNRAVNELGGAAALQAIQSVRYRMEGPQWVRLQTPEPEPPFSEGVQRETILLDVRGDRLRVDRYNNGAGEENDDTIVVVAGKVISYNHRSHAIVPLFAPQARRRYAHYYRRMPQLLLRQALDNAESLRYLGRDEFNGKPHDVISFVAVEESR